MNCFVYNGGFRLEQPFVRTLQIAVFDTWDLKCQEASYEAKAYFVHLCYLCNH